MVNPGHGQKMCLEHLFILENEEGNEDPWWSKKIHEQIFRGFHWPKIGQFEHHKNLNARILNTSNMGSV